MKHKFFSTIIIIIIAFSLSSVFFVGAKISSSPMKNFPQSENKLIIYTYDYFFGLTNETLSGEVYEQLFGAFETKYGVDIEIRFFDGARNILLTALQEWRTGTRTADLLIGLDNIVVQEAKKAGILEKIDPSELENITKIRDDLISNFDPEYYGITYDFGPIAFIYDSDRINITDLKFEDFYDKDLSSKLVVEDPTQSTTGIAFLLWQIGIYEKLLNKSWKEWWFNVRDNIVVAKSWGDAYFNYFLNEEAGRPIVVSYLTSPVYHYLYDNTTRYKPMLTKYQDKWYTWFQIQGIGIVKNSPMKNIALKFIDWMLSDEIQEMIISNDIMLPANENALNNISADLLEVMGFDISEIEPVNNLISVDEIYENIGNWLNNWKEIMGPGIEFMWLVVISTAIIIIVAVIVLVKVELRKKK